MSNLEVSRWQVLLSGTTACSLVSSSHGAAARILCWLWGFWRPRKAVQELGEQKLLQVQPKHLILARKRKPMLWVL